MIKMKPIPLLLIEKFYMLRYIARIFLALIICQQGYSQSLITTDASVKLALDNQRNIKAGMLAVVQQQQILNGVAGLDNPQLQFQASPYEPGVISVQQSFSLPGVYRTKRALQNERFYLAKLQLSGSIFELKKAVRLSYFQLQYLIARINLLTYQDSIYQAIKIASKRFFDAGQINKLEELQATSQADRIRNDLMNGEIELNTEKQIFRYYTNLTDSFSIEPIKTYTLSYPADSISNTIALQILQQQIIISQRELQLEKTGLLPQLTAGLLLPTTKNYVRPVGYQFGITLPIWAKQNRSRISAAKTGIEISKAEAELGQLRLNAQYRQALSIYQKESQRLSYFINTALPQAKAIIETAQRLFQGGELNYIESLRNLQIAFEIYNDHLEAHKAYSEAVIQLKFLNQTL